MKRPLSPRNAQASKAGLSLVELSVMMALFLIAMLAFSRSVKDSIDLGDTSHESALAREAAQKMLEEMRGLPFDEIFARFNSDPADDPGGAGTAPGANFAVPGLRVLAADADGMAGAISLPELLTAGVMELREDQADLALGTPRDLNLDGVLDAFDHSADYLLLPVSISIQWRGPTGTRTLSVHSILSDR